MVLGRYTTFPIFTVNACVYTYVILCIYYLVLVCKCVQYLIHTHAHIHTHSVDQHVSCYELGFRLPKLEEKKKQQMMVT